MTPADPSSSPPAQLLSDHLLSIHLLFVWIITLVFCWKVFPTIFSSSVSSAAPRSSKHSQVSRSPPSVPGSYPPSSSGDCPPPHSTNKAAMARHSVSSSKKLVSHLQLEACTKAKEAGKHPSYTSLVLSLIHHYNLDVNDPVLANSFTIFHCACLSGSLELVSSLSPIADIHRLTDHGDSPLYLAVYAAAHKAGKAGDPEQHGVEVVQHLLQAGSKVNQTNLAGFTALYQASRLSCPELVRILLDWGADAQSGTEAKAGGSTRNMSIISRSCSVVTRSMTNKVDRGEGLNKSVMMKGHTQKQKK